MDNANCTPILNQMMNVPHQQIELVRFVLFDEKTLAAYQEVLKKLPVD